MDFKRATNSSGVTLIELLVALVILGLAVGAIYRLFIAQSRAFSVQDQVVEIQQNIRLAEAVLVGQLRMAGYDNDYTDTSDYVSKNSKGITSGVAVTNAVSPGPGNSAVSIQYEDVDNTGKPIIKTVTFLQNGTNMERQVYNNGVLDPGTSGVLLERATLNFTYGVDVDNDGSVHSDQWYSTAGLPVGAKVIAIAFTITTQPDPTKPDVEMISPRSLSSTVMLRNPMVRR